MKFISLLPLIYFSTETQGCPFSSTTSDNAAPDDKNHKHLTIEGGGLRKNRSTRMYASLSEDETTRKAIAEVINRRSRENRRRSLQTSCVSTTVYNNISSDIAAIAAAISNTGDRGHFFGGIVRLAAHDFMDFDRNAEDDPTSQALGPDGCLDFSHPANAGLPALWCDNAVQCPLKALYDDNYAFMSKADFWVAAANGVIKETSRTSNDRPNGLELPFRWGRVDNDSCTESSARLPEPHGCSQIEGTFINRMGLSWRDATALMGAHTLGRGSADFSGHDGTWVDTNQESTIFDKRFYEEVMRRSWRPRQTSVGVNWTWGGNNNGPFLMLNTDMCLRFDINEGNTQDCCSDTSGNCRDNSIQNNQCGSSESVRPEAFQAFNEFIGGANLNNSNNEPFYIAFSSAWEAATEVGYSDGELFDLVDSCGDTAAPVISPTTPTTSPVTRPPITTSCADPTFEFKMTSKKFKTCEWVAMDQVSRCNNLDIEKTCPVVCESCDVCQDSPLKFKINLNGSNEKHTCSDWVSQDTVSRCAIDGVAEACRQTCGLC